ncbi:MAG: MauE/DoxX family redox-associated membrane protein [Thermodesulfobacteriota bacterium]
MGNQNEATIRTGAYQSRIPGISRPKAAAFHAARLFMGGVFLYASYDKILKPAAFAEAVYNYQLLPDAAVNLAALVLPWLELLLGICLIAGAWLPGATLVSTGLMTVFIAALMYNLARGLDIHCGCFSTETTEGPVGIWTVLRDFAFLAVSVYLMLHVFFFRKGLRSFGSKQHPENEPSKA